MNKNVRNISEGRSIKLVINVTMIYNLSYEFRTQNVKYIEKMKLMIYNHNLNYMI